MENKNKRTDFAIVIPKSALRFALELIAHDNPRLKPQIKELLKAYGE